MLTVSTSITIKDESGKLEADASVNIYNLEGVEASATAAEIAVAIAGVIKGYHASTGEPAS